MEKDQRDIEDVVAGIETKKDFEHFLRMLVQEFRQGGEDWENNSLERYLESLHGFAMDVAGYYRNMQIDVNPDEPSWRVFADMLLAATIYE